MSEIMLDVDAELWERYLDDLKSLSLEHPNVKLFPSLKDFSVWKQDQNIDEDTHEE